MGEIGQHFCDRRNQHQRDVKNKKPSNRLYAHLKENKGHKINWEGFVYLDSEKNWKRRKIKEAIYINAVNPAEAMGSNKILNLGFNEEYRNIIAKKMELQRNDVLWCHFLYILFRLSHILFGFPGHVY